jgi:hypothetical protein
LQQNSDGYEPSRSFKDKKYQGPGRGNFVGVSDKMVLCSSVVEAPVTTKAEATRSRFPDRMPWVVVTGASTKLQHMAGLCDSSMDCSLSGGFIPPMLLEFLGDPYRGEYRTSDAEIRTESENEVARFWDPLILRLSEILSKEPVKFKLKSEDFGLAA